MGRPSYLCVIRSQRPQTREEPFCFPRERIRGVDRDGAPELRLGLVDRARPEQQQPEVETDGRRAREPPCERAEAGERGGRFVLVEACDRGGDERLRVVRGERGRLS